MGVWVGRQIGRQICRYEIDRQIYKRYEEYKQIYRRYEYKKFA